jgi:hypothetical protein
MNGLSNDQVAAAWTRTADHSFYLEPLCPYMPVVSGDIIFFIVMHSQDYDWRQDILHNRCHRGSEESGGVLGCGSAAAITLGSQIICTSNQLVVVNMNIRVS